MRLRNTIAFLTMILAGIEVSALPANSARAPQPDEVTIDSQTIERTGPLITIGYKIQLGENVRWCKTQLYISVDGGRTFNKLSSYDSVSGDIGKISKSGDKAIVYDVSSDKEELAGKQIAFKVSVEQKDVLKTEMLIEASIGAYPQLSYGAMFGMVKKVGWYVKARSDFRFPSISYNCTSDGKIEGGGTVWTNGESQKTRLAVTGGALFRAAKWCYPYVGLGYGYRNLCWQDFQGRWMKVTDQSCSGVAIDAGLILKFGKFSISAGVNNTMFKYTEAEVGIGVMF